MPKLQSGCIRATQGHLRRARMATTTITPMHAHPTATMDQAGSRAESFLASGPGGAGAGTTSMADVALAGGATMEAGGPFPGAEDFAVGSLTVTPVEADVASAEADVASVEADMPSVEAEAEAVPMVVGAGRLHHQLEALAADSICCRPLRFRSRAALPIALQSPAQIREPRCATRACVTSRASRRQLRIRPA